MQLRQRLWLGGGALLALALVAAAAAVIGLIVAVSSFSLGGIKTITAEYPDLRVGGVSNGWGWEYRWVEVTCLQTTEIMLTFRNHPPVRLKDMTPQTAFAWQWDGHAVPAGETPLDNHDYLVDGATIGFQDGVVTTARFSHCRDLLITRGGKTLELPISKRDFEGRFGRPTITKTGSKWN